MPVNKNGLTKEMIAKAMQCKTAEDYYQSRSRSLSGGTCRH